MRSLARACVCVCVCVCARSHVLNFYKKIQLISRFDVIDP